MIRVINNRNFEVFVESEFTSNGLKCVMLGYPMGHRCGYVAISKESPYLELDDETIDNINVHGGVTFGGELPIIDNGQNFWVGFDCAHYMDAKDQWIIDQFDTGYELSSFDKVGKKRNTNFVKRETRKLAKQLVKLGV